jgi:anti-sigma regulatory factor (Ser/Thr protein kinase)
MLQERQIAPGRIATAELLVSELVTNAVKVSGTMKPGLPCGAAGNDIQPIILRLRLAAGYLAIEVADSSEQPPVLRPQHPDSEEGRGLFLVESLSARWDYFRRSDGGKVVWCELDIAREVSASDMTALLSSLPRRSRGSTRSARRLAAMTDPVLLRRVRDGLLALGSEEGPAK